MIVPCPHCGERPHSEFTYGIDGALDRPADPEAVSDAVWLDYLYFRTNERGLHRELWHHTLGCEQWVLVERDTLTHAIGGSAPA